jgi:hypothetical protein
LQELPKWAADVLPLQERDWSMKEGVLCLSPDDELWRTSRPGLAFYEQVGGVEQGRMVSDWRHSSYYDAPRYSSLVRGAVEAVGGVGTAVDLGAGDGRGTMMLLDAGVEQIIALDFHLVSLRRMLSRVPPALADRVVAVQAPVNLPRGAEGVDFVLASEIVTTLADRATAFRAIREWLGGEGSAALVIEPAVESSVFYALIAHDWEAVARIAASQKRLDQIGDAALEVTVSTRDALRREVEEQQLGVLAEYTLPGGAALGLRAYRAGGREPDEQVIEALNRLEHVPARVHALLVARIPPG